MKAKSGYISIYLQYGAVVDFEMPCAGNSAALHNDRTECQPGAAAIGLDQAVVDDCGDVVSAATADCHTRVDRHARRRHHPTGAAD